MKRRVYKRIQHEKVLTVIAFVGGRGGGHIYTDKPHSIFKDVLPTLRHLNIVSNRHFLPSSKNTKRIRKKSIIYIYRKSANHCHTFTLSDSRLFGIACDIRLCDIKAYAPFINDEKIVNTLEVPRKCVFKMTLFISF